MKKDLKSTTLSGYYQAGGSGDKKLIYRTDVITKYPEYPVFEGEKYVGLNYKYLLGDQAYELSNVNPYCRADGRQLGKKQHNR